MSSSGYAAPARAGSASATRAARRGSRRAARRPACAISWPYRTIVQASDGEARAAQRCGSERAGVELACSLLRSRDVVPGAAVRCLPLGLRVDPRAELLLVLRFFSKICGSARPCASPDSALQRVLEAEHEVRRLARLLGPALAVLDAALRAGVRSSPARSGTVTSRQELELRERLQPIGRARMAGDEDQLVRRGALRRSTSGSAASEPACRSRRRGRAPCRGRSAGTRSCRGRRRRTPPAVRARTPAARRCTSCSGRARYSPPL